MIRNFKVGDAEMEFKASACTPILYKKLFKEDLLVELASITKTGDEVQQGSKMQDLINQLAYIMYAEANLSSKELFSKLKEEDFMEWLLNIEPSELLKNSANIIDLYRGNNSQTSNSKNV